MYRRPKFLEALLEIRREMAREADYDVDLFTEIARSGNRAARSNENASSEFPDADSDRRDRRNSENIKEA